MKDDLRSPVSCPVCRARFHSSSLCPRCGADLTALMLFGNSCLRHAPGGPPITQAGRLPSCTGFRSGSTTIAFNRRRWSPQRYLYHGSQPTFIGGVVFMISLKTPSRCAPGTVLVGDQPKTKIPLGRLPCQMRRISLANRLEPLRESGRRSWGVVGYNLIAGKAEFGLGYRRSDSCHS
jgi:hypothetical protein